MVRQKPGQFPNTMARQLKRQQPMQENQKTRNDVISYKDEMGIRTKKGTSKRDVLN
jgi:hypothetical protein